LDKLNGKREMDKEDKKKRKEDDASQEMENL
jgi:hypothetical protein